MDDDEESETGAEMLDEEQEVKVPPPGVKKIPAHKYQTGPERLRKKSRECFSFSWRTGGKEADERG